MMFAHITVNMIGMRCVWKIIQFPKHIPFIHIELMTDDGFVVRRLSFVHQLVSSCPYENRFEIGIQTYTERFYDRNGVDAQRPRDKMTTTVFCWMTWQITILRFYVTVYLLYQDAFDSALTVIWIMCLWVALTNERVTFSTHINLEIRAIQTTTNGCTLVFFFSDRGDVICDQPRSLSIWLIWRDPI